MLNPADSALAAARAGRRLDDEQAYALIQLPGSELEALCAVAAELRNRAHPATLSYSPKVFLPVTNLCRDRCSYCTFRRDPGDEGEWTMSLEEISDCCRRGYELGCIEALLCLGDKPEIAFRGFAEKLAAAGVRTTVEYVAAACRVALREYLLPHTNAGVMSRDEMKLLRPLNVSMGLMLENISPRLRDRGMPHHYAPDKDPAKRLQMIAEAGELRIPFTTGILIGIGENEAERVASLLAIRRLHERYGHIQEVIVQNFCAKPGTGMAEFEDPGEDEMIRTVALARLILGASMNLQAPPNLNPGAQRRLIEAGINDWGGISPLTIDYVNPEAAWPAIEALRGVCERSGFGLEPRLPVYPEFRNQEFLDPAMLAVMERYSDGEYSRGAVA